MLGSADRSGTKTVEVVGSIPATPIHVLVEGWSLSSGNGYSFNIHTAGFGSLHKPSNGDKAGDCDIFGCLTENTYNLYLTFCSRATAGEHGYGKCLEIGTRCRNAEVIDGRRGTNSARISASRIV